MSGRNGVPVVLFAIGFIAANSSFSAAAEQAQQPAFVCIGETIARGLSNRVIDGRTFVLDDGREVRLAAIEVPPLSSSAGTEPQGAATRDALAGLPQGSEVVLRQAEPQKADRYGRLVAYAFTARDGVDRSVQADLIAAGRARVVEGLEIAPAQRNSWAGRRSRGGPSLAFGPIRIITC